jgi:hypothetical protein
MLRDVEGVQPLLRRVEAMILELPLLLLLQQLRLRVS